MKKTKKQTRNSGQMLIEIVVAVGIIGLVLVGVADLMTRSVRVVSFQKQKDEAIAVIKKKLIAYQAERDSDPEGFYATIDNAIMDPCETDSVYRCVLIVDKKTTSVVINISAEWEDGGKTYSVNLSQELARAIK